MFKNRGKSAGASMAHSHSQLIALPVMPHNKLVELQGAQEYYIDHQRCMLCDIIQHETLQSEHIRLIDEDEHFVTVAPYASTLPYEIWLVPKRHSSNYETIIEEEVTHPPDYAPISICLSHSYTSSNLFLWNNCSKFMLCTTR